MKSSLSRQILIPILLLFTLGLVTTLVVTSFFSRRAALSESGQRLQRETGLATRLIDNWLQARMIDLHLWAQEDTLLTLVGEPGFVKNQGEKAQRFLATQHSGHTYMEGIFVADTAGNVLAFSTMAAHPLAQIRLGDRLYFRQTLSGKQVISPLVESKLSGNRIFIVTAPIQIHGEIRGVIGAVIDFSAFSDLFISGFREQTNTAAFLVDSRETILTTSHPQSGSRFESLQRLGNGPHLISRQPLQRTNWTVVISQPTKEVLQPLTRAVQISTLMAAILLLALSLLVITLFHRRLNQRLQTMIQVIGQVQQGDLSCRISPFPAVQDEVSDLAHSFNQMIQQLEGNISLLNREIAMRKDSEHMLSYHQQNLETIIAERSLALEKEIIERQQIEERLARSEKLEMIGTLAGGVAHDLNNILSGIVTYPDLLLLKIPPDSPLVQPLRSIKRTGEKAAAIVQDLLTLSGRRCLSKASIDLDTLLQNFLRSEEYCQLIRQFPNVTVRYDNGAPLPFLQGSTSALSIVLLHLVGFAAMMMGSENGTVTFTAQLRTLDTPIQAYEQIDAGVYCVLGMTSSHHNLAPEYLARIFEPFYTSKKLGLQGTGLEMAVILGTIKDHHGFIDCSSDQRSGSCFRLYFPVSPDQACA